MKNFFSIDNVLPKFLHERLCNTIISKLVWQQIPYTINPTEKCATYCLEVLQNQNNFNYNVSDEGFFCSKIFSSSEDSSGLEELKRNESFIDEFLHPLNYATLKANINLQNIHRIKVNTTFRGNGICFPHWDAQEVNFYSMVYYPFGGDGNTLLFDKLAREFYDQGDWNLIHSFQPKENSAVIFPSDIVHTSELPKINATRTIVNYVFKSGD